MKTHELFEQDTGAFDTVRLGLEFELRSPRLSHEELLDVAKQLVDESGGQFDWQWNSVWKHRVKKPDGSFAYNQLGIDAFYPLKKVQQGKAHVMKKGRRMSRSPKAPWYLVHVRTMEMTIKPDGRVLKMTGPGSWGPREPYHR